MLNLDTSSRLHRTGLQRWVASLMRKRRPDAWCGLMPVERSLPVRFVCPAEVLLICVSGVAWITTAEDTRDVVLEPGQRHIAAYRARLFINGMPRCVLRIEPVPRP